MTLSLRAKITFALFLTGLSSAVLVGLIARQILFQQFNDVVFENSFRSFREDLAAYLEQHGTWEAGHAEQPFAEFVRARRTRGRAGPPPGDRRPPPMPGRRPLPPEFGDADRPPFLFMLLDAGGRVVQAPPGTPYRRGDPAPEDLRAQAQPVTTSKGIVGYAVPLDQPNLSTFDRTYLEATQNAVAIGVAGAGVVALGLGFYFSSRLSANLRSLAQAIEAMGEGKLRQHVSVRSRDEVGVVAEAFNRMSAELSQAHAELQRSHDTIHEQAERLKELSIRDEGTRLHNRRYFDEQAGLAFVQAERYGRPFAVAIGDIDHFKQINDRCSHAIGDEVLRRVGRILAGSTRETDVVARYGGEEFVIAFTETPMADAIATCERIRRAIEEQDWQAVADGLRVTITFGVDGHVARGSVHAMLAAADARLYEGKQRGRNCVRGENAPLDARRSLGASA